MTNVFSGDGRIATLGATRDFHHGLPGPSSGNNLFEFALPHRD